jgi:inosose dehydratase
MGNIRIGCQTYTWQMSGTKYLDQLPYIMQIAAQAGFAGLEPETQFLGRLWDVALMQDTLAAHHLKLAALTLVEDWLHPTETDMERAHADKTIEFLKAFPDTVLAIVQMPGSNRANLKERQVNLLKCVNAIAKRGQAQGLTCTYHPNSPEGSVVRTAEDYEFFLNGLDQSVIGYAPDVGHIAKGGMDPLTIIKQYRSLVNHVHYKDMDKAGDWAAMGAGMIDFVGITTYLRDSGYTGWLIIEDECERAVDEPDAVTLKDGVYVKDQLLPIVTT